MSDPGKAIFLSYASQDAEAARRICEALRGAGIEVWFDQNELVGGDAWDAKIRKQIKDCALFVPVISANTNARLEGYFRREWRLAVERMHDMDDEVPFLLPVVIDDTTDAAARVPERFRERQWVRLPGGAADTRFCERVNRLLTGEAATGRRTLDFGPGIGNSEGRSASRVPIGRWLIPAIIAAVVAVGLPVWKMTQRAERPTGQTSESVSEARKVAERARVLMEEDDLNQENFRLAEELLRRAVELDPTDGEVLAIYAQLSLGFLRFGFDSAPARADLARSQAERALKLAPNAWEARFAQAYYYYRFNGVESERLLREMHRERPADKRILRTLGLALRRQDRDEESIVLWQQAAALPGGDAMAQREIALSLFALGRPNEAEAAVDESLRLHPMVRSWLLKAEIQMMSRGDLAGAETTLGQLPAWALLEDRGAFLASQVRLWRRETTAAIAMLEKLPRDYLIDNLFAGPKSYLIGLAHRVGQRETAAQSEWRIALGVVERRLAGMPRSEELLYWRALLLAALDRADEAQQAWILFDQSTPGHRSKGIRLAQIDALLGRAEPALDKIETYLKAKERWQIGVRSSEGNQYVGFRFTEHALRLDPTWDALRGNPRYEKLVATAQPAAANSKTVAGDRDSRSTPNSEATNSPLADSKSVVVLPFANLSGDPEQEYFSDGLTEEILNALARERDLRVPGRASAFSFKGKGASAAEIAKALNVAQLVEGSVRKAGNRVRISVQLTRASDGFSEALPTVERELTDIFALQDEVARTAGGAGPIRASNSLVQGYKSARFGAVIL